MTALHPSLPAGYAIDPSTPDLATFKRLRDVSGLSPYSDEAASQGLKGTIFAVQILHGETPIGMGRLVGDGGCVFIISDIAVDPAHQGKGLGKVIMATIMDHVNTALPSRAYVSLVADLPADQLYAQFGFVDARPASIAMAYRVK